MLETTSGFETKSRPGCDELEATVWCIPERVTGAREVEGWCP